MLKKKNNDKNNKIDKDENKIEDVTNKEDSNIYLSKNICKDECCFNCEYSISPDVIDTIIEENSEYQDMSYDEAIKKIGYCELYETKVMPSGFDFWCSSYLKKEEQVPVKKLNRR